MKNTWQAAWRGLVKLNFISLFFTWLMELLARITEPLASLSAIYIIIVAGVPQLFSDRLYTLALALIIGSPELLVVGAFKIASRELARRNAKGWWLMGACLLLLLLTALTVGDLFMWHWSQDAVNVLMGCRCLAGIAYAFTRGVVTDGESEPDLAPGSPVNTLLSQFTANMQEMVNQTRDQLLAEVNQVKQCTQAEVHRLNEATIAEVSRLMQGILTEQSHLVAQVNQMNQGVHHELTQAASVLAEQSQIALDAAIERLEHTQSQRLQTVYQRLEQVTVSLAESSPQLPVVHSGPRAPRQIASRRLNQEHEPGNQVHRENEPADGSMLNQGRQFTIDHYRASGSLPTLAAIIAAVGCSKGLASRAYNLAQRDLGLKAAQ